MRLTCSSRGAILLGGIAGVIVVYGVELLEWLRIDDPIGAVPVHGICGIWGTLSLGLFACGKYGATGPFAADNSAPLKGLFYGGGTQVLVAQMIGSAAITVSTFVVALVVMKVVDMVGLLRVSNEGGAMGLDLHEHGRMRNHGRSKERKHGGFPSPVWRAGQLSEGHADFAPGSLP